MNHAPLTITSARVLLAILFSITAYGLVDNGRRFLLGASPGSDLFLLNWSLGLTIASAFSFWAIGRRRPIGRWMAVALFVMVIVQSIRPGLYALRATQGELDPPSGMIAFSPAEARGALVVHVLISGTIALQALLLARGRAASRYFAPDPKEHNVLGLG
jgi:hypothetical protein